MREIFDRLLKQCKEEQDLVADSMTAGSCSDFAAYRFNVGEVEGLNRAIEVIRTEFKKLNEEDEEDE